MFCSMGFKRTIVGLLTTSLLAMVACQGGEAPEIAASDRPAEPDVEGGDGKTEGRLYQSDHPYHRGRMDDLLRRSDVASVVASLEVRGYELLSDGSFTIEGGDGETDISATFLVMERDRESGATIVCAESGDDFGIATTFLSTSPVKGERGWEKVADGVWIRGADAQEINLSAQRLDWWSGEYFLNCMAVHAPTVFGGCAISCAFTLVGYWGCMLVCCGGQAIATTVACLISTFLHGSKEVKKE